MKKLTGHIIPNLGTLIILGLFLFAQAVGAFPFSGVSTQSATLPALINYQGQLNDAGGTPVPDGSYTMTFRLYSPCNAGTASWTEVRDVTVSSGLFNVMLGEVTALPSPFPSDSVCLGVKVGADAEMTPREPLGSVPFALVANVPDGSITTAKLADGAVTAAKLAGDLTLGNLSLEQQTVQLGGFGTSSLSFVDIPGSEISVTVDKPSTLLVSFSGSLFTLMQANSAAGAVLTINVDGTDRTDLVEQDLFAWSGVCCAPNPAIAPVGFMALVPVDAGTHTVKLRVRVNAAYDPDYYSAGIGYNGRNSTLSVIVLGS